MGFSISRRTPTFKNQRLRVGGKVQVRERAGYLERGCFLGNGLVLDPATGIRPSRKLLELLTADRKPV